MKLLLCFTLLFFALFFCLFVCGCCQVFVEYSNEVWGLLFPQGAYAQRRGLALGLSSDPSTAQYRFYSQRSVQIFKIVESVIGSSRVLEKVLATWTESPAATGEVRP